MAATPPEYYVRYRRTDVSNRNNHNEAVFWPLSAFTVSGNTGIAMGKITRIVFRHPHTSTTSVNWKLFGRLSFGDGTSLDSDTVSHKFSGDLYTYVNTFDTSALTVEKWQTCTGVYQMFATPLPTSGTLYYRAVSDAPVDVYVYFWAASDMTEGAEPPTVSGVTITDNAGHIATFGDVVQAKSDLTITGLYQLDPNYPYLTASHTLQLTGGGTSLYQATQDGNATFNVGTINASGTISWSYTCTDNAGNSVTATGSFTALAYSPPSFASLSVERYIETLDDFGHITYVASDDGEQVWFSLAATIAQLGNANAWTLKLLYGDENTDESEGTEITVQTGTDGGTITKTNDRSILSDTVSASLRWWFKFTIADSLSTVSLMVYADEASAFFDVEENGVAVGMRSTGSASDKRFEVADEYESHFYGGIAGVTNYVAGEAATGGKWIDGKPIYRFVAIYEAVLLQQQIVATIPAEVDTLITLRGIWNNQNPIPYAYYANENWESSIFLQPPAEGQSTIILQVGESMRINSTVLVIAEYTKDET